MTNDFFRDQLKRLRTRFGDKAFDAEFIQLVWREVHDMSEPGFQRFCDVLIGSRTASKPPLLSEFREARTNEQKLRFENEVRGAARSLRLAPEEMRKHLQEILHKDFGAVESISDAFEIAKLKRRTPDDGGREGA